MAKTMARIKNDVVVNLEWVDDNVKPTDELKDTYDLQVGIGDTYSNGIFYHDGIEVLTYRRRIRNMLLNYDTALTEIEERVSMPMTFAMREETTPTIEDRKQNILLRVEDILAALGTLEVVPSE